MRNRRDPREGRAFLKDSLDSQGSLGSFYKAGYSQASIWANLRPMTMPSVVHEPMEVPTR